MDMQVWMLTGDKLETAVNIAKSAGLVSRAQPLHVFPPTGDRDELHAQLNAARRKHDAALVILGCHPVSLTLFLTLRS